VCGPQSLDVTNGTFRFDGLPAGTHTVTASNPSFLILPQRVAVGPDTLDVTIKTYRWNNLDLEMSSNGIAHLVYAGTNGQMIRIITSTDLQQWVSLSAQTVNSSNYFEVFDDQAAGHPVRFYRTTQP